MMPKEHILFGVALSIIFFIFGMDNIEILLIVFASILIDIDHAIEYMFKFRSCNLLKMNRYFRRCADLKNSKERLTVYIFHNIETLIVLSALTLYSSIALYIFIGFAIHMSLDWGVMPTDRYPAVIKMSLILVLIENYNRSNGNPKW